MEIAVAMLRKTLDNIATYNSFHQLFHFSRKDLQSDYYFIFKSEVERANLLQQQLFELAQTMSGQFSFIPESSKPFLSGEIKGEALSSFCAKKLDWCVEVSKEAADDYQRLIKKAQENNLISDNLPDLARQGIFLQLILWSKPIIDAGLIDFSLIQKLKDDFECWFEKNDNCLGWFHGNIVDDLIVSKNDIYLFNFSLVPRMGKNYYDFLRSLNSIFLKFLQEKRVIPIERWIKKYLSHIPQKEIKLVMALEALKMLGQNILYHSVEDNLKEQKIILRFVKREW